MREPQRFQPPATGIMAPVMTMVLSVTFLASILAVSAMASLGVRSIGDEQDLTCVAGGRVLPTFHGLLGSNPGGLFRQPQGRGASDPLARARDDRGLPHAHSLPALRATRSPRRPMRSE